MPAGSRRAAATGCGPAARKGHSPPSPPPEIASADLTRLALELALWGVADPGGLAFLTPPPAAAFAEARALLAELAALDGNGRLTDHGRALAALPLHPRLAHMLVVSADHGAAAAGGRLAALVEARDPLRGRGADLGLAPRGAAPGPCRCRSPCPRRHRRRGAPPRGARPQGAWRRSSRPGAALSLAYPDRIAARRPGDRAALPALGWQGRCPPRRGRAGGGAVARRRRPRRRPARGRASAWRCRSPRAKSAASTPIACGLSGSARGRGANGPWSRGSG